MTLILIALGNALICAALVLWVGLTRYLAGSAVIAAGVTFLLAFALGALMFAIVRSGRRLER